MDDHFWRETYDVWAPVTHHYEKILLTEKTYVQLLWGQAACVRPWDRQYFIIET